MIQEKSLNTILMKEKEFLFTDGSVNPKKKIGFGAYLYVKL